MAQFTTETAREAQRKAAMSRRANRVNGGRDQPQAQPQSSPQNPVDTAFLSAQCTGVRAEMERTLTLLAETNDPRDRDRLANAYGRLEESERKMSGRALPGTKKLAPEKERSRAHSVLGI
jgi:hypothetical protein